MKLKQLLFFIVCFLFGALKTFAFQVSGYEYKILSNSEEEGYTVEFQSTNSMYVTIPETVTYNGIVYTVIGIGDNAFAEKNITANELNLPSTLQYIGKNAFGDCTFGRSSSIKYIAIKLPKGIKRIGNGAFQHVMTNTNMFEVSLELPDSLEEIPESAFEFSAFKNVDIPKTVKKIGKWAFRAYLGGILGGEGVEEIGESAFEGAKKLTSGNFKNLKKLERGAFSSSYFKSLILPPSLTSVSYSAFSGCKQLEKVVFEGSLDVIPDNAFCGCELLSEVNLPQGFTSIGISAFKDCKMLTNIILPNDVKNIKRSAFENSGLTSINLPNGINEIGERAFYSTQLEKIKIPDSLKILPAKVFACCENLKTVSFFDFADEIVNLEEIGEDAFYNDVNLKIGLFTKKLKRIGARAFYGCKNMKYLCFEEGITTIEEDAFRNVPIDELYIPKSLTSLASSAFNIKDLKRLFCFTEVPPSVLDGFMNQMDNPEIVVPCSCVDSYRSNASWSRFTSYKTMPTWVGVPQKDQVEYGDNIPDAHFVWYWGDYFPTDYELSVEEMGVPKCLDSGHIALEVGSHFLETAWEKTSSNTIVALVGGKYTVTKATLKISAPTIRRIYGGVNPDIELSYSGFKNNETEEVLTAAATVNIEATQDSPVGEYPIIVSGGAAENYEINHVSGKLIIEKAPQTIEWIQNFEEIEAGSIVTLDATSTSGESVTYVSSNRDIAEIEGNMITFKAVGLVEITAEQEGNTNYLAAEPVKKLFEVVVPTNIADVSLNRISIHIESGSIVLEGKAHDTQVQITTTDGRCIYSGYDRRIKLQSGIYIVTLGRYTTKIAI